MPLPPLMVSMAVSSRGLRSVSDGKRECSNGAVKIHTVSYVAFFVSVERLEV